MKSFGTLDDAIKNAAVEVIHSDNTRTVQNVSVNEAGISAATQAKKKAEEAKAKKERITKFEGQIVSSNFSKIAKRSKAWLLAINEQ